MISIRLAWLLTLAVLLLTLFTNVTKAVLGTRGNLVVDVLFLVALTLLLVIGKVRYTKLVALLVAYVLVHAVGQLLTYGGLLSYNYTDYRNLLRGGVFFLLLLNTNFRSTDEINAFFKWIVVIVGSLILVNIYAEQIAYKGMGLDLRSLPYVVAAYRDVETVYGDPEAGARIPTLLGAPQFFGLTQASLAFVLWHLGRQGHPLRLLLLLTLVSLLFLSRLQLFVVAITIFAYYVRGSLTSRTRLAAFLLSLAALAYIVREFGYAIVLTFNPDFILAYEYLVNYASPRLFLELIVFPDVEDLYKLVIGVGGVTGNAQFDQLINLAYIEVGLIVEVIPRYGLIFVALYYAVLGHTLARLRAIGNNVLALAMIPFMASPLHMFAVNTTFVSDMLFFILAYCHLLIGAREMERGFEPAAGAAPAAALARPARTGPALP
jgi:hypothetical protein